jgi:hypothetical protein
VNNLDGIEVAVYGTSLAQNDVIPGLGDGPVFGLSILGLVVSVPFLVGFRHYFHSMPLKNRKTWITFVFNIAVVPMGILLFASAVLGVLQSLVSLKDLFEM